MSDRQALLDAIRDHPDEDTPRLIFADWCDENGEGDRAEFVRVQCALEREGSHELRLRQLDLLAGCEREWLGEWADRLVRWTFRRGFLHEIVFTPAEFLDAAELFRREPIWGVSFGAEDGATIDPAAAWDLVRAPHFAHIRALHVTANRPDEFAYSMYCGGHPGGDFCAGLARAPHVTRLRELDLSAGLRSGSGVHHSALHFANAPHLSGLRALHLCGEADDADTLLPVLARAPFAPNLERLDLGQQPIARAWDTAIGERWFPKLRACAPD